VIEVTALNTLFMFLTASSFAFATVGSIKKSLIDFFEFKIEKLIKDDSKRQKRIFGLILADASVDYTDEDIKNERDTLQKALKLCRDNAKKFAECKLTRILKKYRLITFAIGLQSFFFIFLSGLYGAKIIIEDYTTLYSFTVLSSLFIFYIYVFYRYTSQRDILQNFKKVAILITASFLFSFLLKNYSLTHEHLGVFSFWIVFQFLLFTVVIPINEMDKKIKFIECVYDTKRNLLWKKYDSVEKAKEASTQNQTNTLDANKSMLKRMSAKYNTK